MAYNSTVAPQAYTREVLTTAFNWLQSQPESIRRQATTPDTLVSLYMRAQRYGDAPVSSQNFMSDLKNLAEGLKQFEDPKKNSETAASVIAQVPHQASFNTQASAQPQATGGQTAPRFSPAPPPPPVQSSPAPQIATGLGLNERSLQMLEEIRAGLNLSSDTETLNLAIALAYKNLKTLLA